MTLDDIRSAIDSGDMDKARGLLRDALKDPSADTYFLASLAALDDEQRHMFLKKATDLDPFHTEAVKALRALTQPTAQPTAPPPAPKPAPAAVIPAAKAQPPAPPPQRSITVPPAQPIGMNVHQATDVRMAINRAGYKHPNNVVSRDYDRAVSTLFAGINPASESVIMHVGIGQNLQDGIMCRKLTITGSVRDNIGRGHLLLTNMRLIALQSNGMGGITGGRMLNWSDVARWEPAEFRGKTLVTLYTQRNGTYEMNMNFTSNNAIALAMLSVATSINQPKTSQYASMGYVIDKNRREESMSAFIGSQMANAQNLKQAFLQVVKVLVTIATQ